MTDQVRHSFPALRAFIFGVEVTDLVSAASCTWTDQRAPSVAELTLANENDALIVTHEDIRALYPQIKAISDSLSKDPDVAVIVAARRAEAAQQIKRDVLAAKVQYFEKLPEGAKAKITDFAGSSKDQSAVDNALTKPAAMTGYAARYPLQVGQCIFHSNDSIRIFMRDIFDATKWYYAFTGYVSDWSESTDASGRRSVRIVGEDVLRNLRHSLITTNWAFSDIQAISNDDRETILRSWFTNSFSGLSLIDIAFTMFFGTQKSGISPATLTATGLDAGTVGRLNKTAGIAGTRPIDNRRVGVKGDVPYQADTEGAGSFNYQDSRVYLVGEPQKNDATRVGGTGTEFQSIEKKAYAVGQAPMDWYQDQVDTLITATGTQGLAELASLSGHRDVPELSTALESFGLLPESNPTEVLAKTRAFITLVGEHPEWFAPDLGRLIMLMPSGPGPGLSSSIMTKDLTNSIATRTQFLNRLQILYNYVEKIDFSLYATPRGDVLIEMPLYDYEPRDFGSYASRYSFSTADTIRHEASFSDEHIRTQYNTQYNLDAEWSFAKSEDLWLAPGVVRLPALIPQFGVRPEWHDGQSFIASEDAAKLYGFIKLNQFNANAWNSRVECVQRLGVGPNRPCFFDIRTFVATVRKSHVGVTWGISGGVQSTLDVNYRRGWSGLTVDRGIDANYVFEPLGGLASRPLNWALLFKTDPVQPTSSTMHGFDPAYHTAHGEHLPLMSVKSLNNVFRWTPNLTSAALAHGITTEEMDDFLPYVQASMLVESRGDPNAAGDKEDGRAHAIGLFQLHDKGRGQGLTVEQRQDPFTNIDTMMPFFVESYRTNRGTMSDRELAVQMAHDAENPAAIYLQRYADAYTQIKLANERGK